MICRPLFVCLYWAPQGLGIELYRKLNFHEKPCKTKLAKLNKYTNIEMLSQESKGYFQSHR